MMDFLMTFLILMGSIVMAVTIIMIVIDGYISRRR